MPKPEEGRACKGLGLGGVGLGVQGLGLRVQGFHESFLLASRVPVFGSGCSTGLHEDSCPCTNAETLTLSGLGFRV